MEAHERKTGDSVSVDYLNAVNTRYAYDIAVELSEDTRFHDSNLGTRTAGSEAEHLTADRLVTEMNSIGLKDVEKVGVKVDKFQFNSASIILAGDSPDKEIILHSYQQPGTPTDGINAEVVYVNKGTMWDYEELDDVTGKIVLFDVNQREEWWVSYPMLEAEAHGAVAALAVQSVGFSEIRNDSYNANDITSPRSIPCLSITQVDADYIKERLDAGPVYATLKSDVVYDDQGRGTSYNVVGRIPGKDSSEMVIIAAHYDMYFLGFQDDTCGVAAVLGIAKAMIDSSYVPERDIYFVLHGSEEWGAAGTPYDWTIGAWRMIYEARPEWVGKALAFINFELPAYEFDNYTSAYSAPEFYSMIDSYVKADAPRPKNGVFPEGVKTAGYPTYTYSDDFSYTVAGVPSIVNGMLLTEDRTSVFDFYYNYYHTNYDTKDTYNDDVMRFSIEFYGTLAMHIAQTPALELDFTHQYQRLLAAIDETTARACGVDYDGYLAAVKAYGEAATAAFKRVQGINAGTRDEAAWKLARVQNDATLALFKETNDELLGLMYETPIVPHQAPEQNIMLMQGTIALLEDGDVVTAVDEYACYINAENEWHNMYFGEEAMAKVASMYNSAENRDNRFWGRGREFVWADVEEATRLLAEKYESEEAQNVSTEIGIYTSAIAQQAEVYRSLITSEIEAIKKLTEELKKPAVLPVDPPVDPPQEESGFKLRSEKMAWIVAVFVAVLAVIF